MGYPNILKLIGIIHLSRLARAALVWNTGGNTAVFVAVAVPIDLTSHNVFMSYNFEANYGLPKTWRQKPPVFRRGNGTDMGLEDDFGDYYDDYDAHGEYGEYEDGPKPPKRQRPRPLKPQRPLKPPKKKNKHKHRKPKPTPAADEDYKDFFEGFPRNKQDMARAKYRQENSLLSRTKFYEILSQRFAQHGFGSGEACLLRLICEANSAQLGDLNGVLGSLMHVLFSPSSSRFEALPRRYYIAELDGQRDRCAEYYKQCKRSVLDLISRPLSDYIGNKSLIYS